MLAFRLITSCRYCWDATRVSTYRSGQQCLNWRSISSGIAASKVSRSPGRSAFEPMCAPEGIEAVVARLTRVGHGPHPPVGFQDIFTRCADTMLRVIHKNIRRRPLASQLQCLCLCLRYTMYCTASFRTVHHNLHKKHMLVQDSHGVVRVLLTERSANLTTHRGRLCMHNEVTIYGCFKP